MKFAFLDPVEQGRRKPHGHVADVEVIFDEAEGGLAGLKLVGLALWSHGSDGALSVTLPSRKVEANGKGKDWFYEFLRADDGPDAADRIRSFKALVTAAFEAERALALAHA